MPINLNREKAVTGELLFSWSVKEYEQHDRSTRWYVAAAVVGGLLLLYSLISGNYLFTLVVVLFGIILFLQDTQPPMDVFFGITEAGVVIGDRYYPFKEITSYWIIYNPPEVKNIYFVTKNVLRQRIKIPLLDNDPLPVRDFLNQFLVEDADKEEEPFTDRLGRVLKLH
jgi:hypothetical protein